MTKMVRIRCHVCWRDKNCNCGGNCTINEALEEHDCDCEFCDRADSNLDELLDQTPCDCICHNGMRGGCDRCSGTGMITYEAIGK